MAAISLHQYLMGFAIRSPTMVRVSGCWDGLPHSCCDAMTLIKEGVGARHGRFFCIMWWGWQIVKGGGRSRGGVGWGGDGGGKSQTAWLSLTVLLELTSELVISIQTRRKIPLERFERWGWSQWWLLWGFPRCSASYSLSEWACITMTTEASGSPGFTHTWKKQKTSFAFCTQPCSSRQINMQTCWFCSTLATRWCLITNKKPDGRWWSLVV